MTERPKRPERPDVKSLRRIGETMADFHPGSVLIVDVTASSAFPEPTELSQYLNQVVSMMEDVATESKQIISAVHRRGDELFVVCEGYTAAYLLAFWLFMTWEYPDYPFYSGVGYGDLKGSVPAPENLETWNSPVAKHARTAIDSLKATRKSNRIWLRFAADDADAKMTERLNEYVVFQDRFLNAQTEAERQVSLLSLVERRKGDIARRLSKDISTVSRQLKRGNIDLVLMAKRRIIEILQEMENDATGVSTPTTANDDNPSPLESCLRDYSRSRIIIEDEEEGFTK